MAGSPAATWQTYYHNAKVSASVTPTNWWRFLRPSLAAPLARAPITLERLGPSRPLLDPLIQSNSCSRLSRDVQALTPDHLMPTP